MTVHRSVAAWVASAAGLVLGSVCAGCGSRAGLLCAACRAELTGPGRLVSVPLSAGSQQFAAGVPVMAISDYGGPTREVILAHKERARLGLAAPLGAGLATSVAALLETAGCAACGRRPVAIVPVPSDRSAVQRRGHDPLSRSARRAARLLRRVGLDVSVVPALRHRRRVADQAGLGAAERHANLAGALAHRGAAKTLLTGRCVVVVDDVVTTGATLGEAARALHAGGIAPCGAAVIAAVESRGAWTGSQDRGARLGVSR